MKNKLIIGFGLIILSICVFMAGIKLPGKVDDIRLSQVGNQLEKAEALMARYVELEYKATQRTKEQAPRVEYLICKKAAVTCQNGLKNGLPVTQETKDQLATFCHDPKDVPEQCRPNIVERVVYDYVVDDGWEMEVLKDLQEQEDYYRDNPTE